MSSNSINIQFTQTNSFVPSAPQQRVNVLNVANPLFARYMTFSQDAAYFNVNGLSQLYIPMYELWAAAASASPQFSYPPVIQSQPTNSVITHPTTSYFAISASLSDLQPNTYQWASASFGSSTFVNLTNNAIYTGSLTPALTHSNTNVGDSGSQYLCYVTNGSGATTSSAAILYVI